MAINVTDLTTGVIGGTGVLDQLMVTVRAHLDSEFDAGRIQGNDYTQAYIANVTAAMQAAVGYAVQKPVADQDILNKQAEVLQINAQTDLTEAETTNTVAALPNIHLQDDLTSAQISQVDAQTDLTEAERTNTAAALPNIQLQDDLTSAQISQVNAETTKVNSENSYVQAQLASETAKVDHTVASATSILGRQASLVGEQVSKTAAETALLVKKLKTESAQTEDVAASNSVIGRQLSLYANQAKGYDVDQKVKVAKLFTDIAAVQLNINENYTVAGTGLENSAIADAANTARNSV